MFKVERPWWSSDRDWSMYQRWVNGEKTVAIAADHDLSPNYARLRINKIKKWVWQAEHDAKVRDEMMCWREGYAEAKRRLAVCEADNKRLRAALEKSRDCDVCWRHVRRALGDAEGSDA